uniref:N-acetyltransferase domain-containing protein n=1 Tax=Plectus sambesii TaxID=2011161 RepID=A0A914WD09_9BILA
MESSKVHLVSSEADLKACMDVRREVFIKEQNVEEEMEVDGLDDVCTHFAATLNDQIVGTCRLRHLGPFVKLERMAVLTQGRGKGVGKALCVAAFKHAAESSPQLLLMAHAQTAVVGFYSSLGMTIVSDVFYEAGIPHQTMVMVPAADKIAALAIWNESIADSGDRGGFGDECDDATVIENIKNVLKEHMKVQEEN